MVLEFDETPPHIAKCRNVHDDQDSNGDFEYADDLFEINAKI